MPCLATHLDQPRLALRLDAVNPAIREDCTVYPGRVGNGDPVKNGIHLNNKPPTQK